MARSEAMGSRLRWSVLLLGSIALACNGSGGSAAGEGGSTGGADDSGDSLGGTVDSADGTAGGSADATGADDDSGTTTGGADCDPVGPWNDPPTGPILISRRPDGSPVTGSAISLSGDGRYAAFASRGDPLSDGGGGGLFELYVYDAVCDTMTKVPFELPTDPVTEALDPVLSDDGSTLVFATRDSIPEGHIFVADLVDGTIEPIDVDLDGSVVGTDFWHYEVSSDGRFVAFHVDRPLVPEDTNGNLDVYLLDRETGELELICPPMDPPVPSIFCGMPAISGDGRHVAYESVGEVFVYDRTTGTEELIAPSPEGSVDNGSSGAPSISDDGRYVAFHSGKRDLVEGDVNNTSDIFVYDRDSETTTRSSVDADGVGLEGPSAIPEISADGSVVVFVMGWYGGADPQAQIYAHDSSAGTTWRISETADGDEASAASSLGKVSADGRWGCFETTAANLLPDGQPSGGWNAFVVALSPVM